MNFRPDSEQQTLNKFHGIQRIISGGQTGVDRAALDVAIQLGIPHGGWCPQGRLCETGRISEKYQLEELSSPDYAARTLKNVQESDGTLILFWDRLRGGSSLTGRFAREQGKPVFKVRLQSQLNMQKFIDWLILHNIKTLNVAGPRGSTHPELEPLAKQFLIKLLSFNSLI